MQPNVLERKGGSWLDDHAREWVDAGLVSAEQAEAIRTYEHAGEASDRVGLVTEVGVYLGSVLAIMGGAVVVGENWRDITLAGRLAIAIAVALVGFTAGTWLMRLAEERTNRLGSFLWLIGTGGVGLGIGVLIDEYRPDPGVGALWVGVPVLVIGAMLWRNLDRPLQLLTAAAGVGITGGGLIELTDLSVWGGGIAVWSVAVVAGVLAATGVIRPRMIALLTAAVGSMFGAMMIGDLDEHLGPAAATVTAAAVVVFALVDRSTPLLIVGVLGFLFSTQALLATTFEGPVASMIVTLIGLAVVVIAVARSLRGAKPAT